MSSARADRLVPGLAERELDCLLVSDLVNVRWLCGFTGTNGAAVVSPDERVFLTDFRYVEQAGAQVEGFELVVAERDLLESLVSHLHGRVGFDDAHLSVRAHGKLSEASDADFVAAGGLVEELRQVKDAAELEAIRAAASLADAAFSSVVQEVGLAGRVERDVARELEAEMRVLGADPSFPAIVASGAHGARPHAEPRDVEIPRDTLVVVDWGAQLDDYCSDCTRTLATGSLEEEALEVYSLVESAQRAALDAVRAGADCRETDAVARSLIEEAGHGEEFGHGLGHGVGLEVHEGPRLTKKAEGSLAAGNVVTVEPGVYVRGRFGVRIEDLVAVTDGGREVLSSVPKSLTEVG